MIVLLHITIALASIAYTTFLFIAPPSRAKLHVSYVLAGSTVASGTYLVWSMQTHILEACTMGLLYIGLVTVGIVTARHKLAADTQKSRQIKTD